MLALPDVKKGLVIASVSHEGKGMKQPHSSIISARTYIMHTVLDCFNNIGRLDSPHLDWGGYNRPTNPLSHTMKITLASLIIGIFIMLASSATQADCQADCSNMSSECNTECPMGDGAAGCHVVCHFVAKSCRAKCPSGKS